MTDVPPWALLAAAADRRYDGEDVSQLQHALQAAALAVDDDAAPHLQLAALLHDVGHLLVADAGAASASGRDLHHERSGARLLARWYGPEVVAPVALHVQAKRWLTRDPVYASALSAESRRTLALQGGPMSDAESAAFEARPGASDAVRLRRWDDLAKDPHAQVPPLDAWLPLARRLARR